MCHAHSENFRPVQWKRLSPIRCSRYRWFCRLPKWIPVIPIQILLSLDGYFTTLYWIFSALLFLYKGRERDVLNAMKRPRLYGLSGAALLYPPRALAVEVALVFLYPVFQHIRLGFGECNARTCMHLQTSCAFQARQATRPKAWGSCLCSSRSQLPSL